MKIKPTSVKKKGGIDLSADINIPLPAFLQPAVKEQDLVVFTRQFATMIDSGLPLVQCLEIQANNVENPTFQKQLTEIKETVEGGAPPSTVSLISVSCFWKVGFSTLFA